MRLLDLPGKAEISRKWPHRFKDALSTTASRTPARFSYWFTMGRATTGRWSDRWRVSTAQRTWPAVHHHGSISCASVSRQRLTQAAAVQMASARSTAMADRCAAAMLAAARARARFRLDSVRRSTLARSSRALQISRKFEAKKAGDRHRPLIKRDETILGLDWPASPEVLKPCRT